MVSILCVKDEEVGHWRILEDIGGKDEYTFVCFIFSKEWHEKDKMRKIMRIDCQS
jgi:hypothetical protein